MSSTVRLGFVGDVMLGRLVDREYRRKDRPPEAVWGSMYDRLRELDGLFCNLECCLSTRGREWRRTHRPFHFRADPRWAVPALDRAGIDFASLANNHVLDFEEEALYDTTAHLSEAGIAHAGAGETIEKAREPAFVSVGDIDVAVVAFTDNTPEYAARPDSPGTAWIEIDRENENSRRAVHDVLARAREHDPDLVVASLHWGPNMVVDPPQGFRAFGRWLLDEGVDLIHGHSAHVFQGIEVYDGAPILYDTGDFVDDYRVDPEMRNDRSFLFEARVDAEGDLRELRLVPSEIDEFAVQEAGSDAAEWNRARMGALSDPFDTAFERDGEDLLLSLDDR